jgi:hypothetical protein
MSRSIAVRALFLSLSVLLFAGAAQPLYAAEGQVRHIVCLKFKEGTSAEDIKKVEVAFRDLKNKIKEVLALEWGTNVSFEKRDKGFTHCFVLTFLDEKDVKTYANHPDHKAFGALLGPIMDDVFVIDFHVKE